MAKDNKQIVGWREWVSLPDLDIPLIKAKIDTGARTSALHAFKVKGYVKKGEKRVRFSVHPYQQETETVVECDAPVVDYRYVTDSGGHKEKRYVIVTTLYTGEQEWEIEMTLTNRDTMKFRMLLGRTAMAKRLIVDPGKSYRLGRKNIKSHKSSRS